ncbi:fibronectin type III domain-containing protein [Paenibacillus sp. CC-CFT747]|nr:fibronectin type III domain-containing protein [Paenibacillus sp. CC-CFT747]
MGGFVLHDRDSDGNGVFDEPDGTSNRFLGSPANEVLLYDSPAVEGKEPAVSVTAWWYGSVPGTYKSVVYLYDFPSGTWKQPLTAAGAEPNANTYGAALSGNGEWLAFYSDATNLDPQDRDGGLPDLYMYRLPTKEWKLAALPDSPDQVSGNASMDETGRYVAAAARPAGKPLMQIYLYDRTTGETELVSRSPSGEPGDSRNDTPSISADGRYVAFQSYSGNLTDKTGWYDQLFIWEKETKSIRAPLQSYDGKEPNGDSEYPVLSGDGSVMAFSSASGNLVSGDGNAVKDVFWMLAGTHTAPDVPSWPPGSRLEATAAGQTEVKLRWTPAEAEQGSVRYRVSYGERQILVEDGGTELTVTGLIPGTSYVFTVQAAGQDGRWTGDGPSLTVKTLPAENAEVNIGQFRVTAPLRYKTVLPPAQASACC